MDADKQKEIIAAELEKEHPDWRVIEVASRGLVDQDPNQVRFSVDAGHIQRLGAELVGKQETALSELIKNAYDADATSVSLTFSNQDRTEGTLVIADNGTGMLESDVRSSWMRISTAEKAEQPLSPIYRRVRAGRKGIGRFSVQRLGKRLLLETRPRGQSTGYRVHFNWDQEFIPGRNLDDVFSQIERFPKELNESGTTLTILNLRDTWSEAAIRKVWRSVILLQPPYRVAPIAALGDEAASIDPGFQVTINGTSRDEQEKLFSIEKSFLDQSLASIEASIAQDGTATVRVTAPKLDLDDSQVFKVKFLNTGPVQLSARYFIYHSSTLSGMNMAVAAEMGRSFGGLRVYRNGFRVLPYGEPSDDWLGLDADVSRRDLLIPANNRNFFGQVELTSADNPMFEETSSREGLLENDAYEELRQFVRSSVEWAAKRVAAARNRKQDAGQRDFVAEPKRPSQFLRDLRQHFGVSASAAAPLPAGADEALAEAEAVAAKYEEKVEAERAAALEYEEMLRLLASLGLSISVFGHEVKGARDAMIARMGIFDSVIKRVTDSSERAALQAQLAALSSASDRMFDIGGYIAGLMSSTESRELRALSVRGALGRFAEQFSEYMSKQKLTFEVDVQPAELRTTPMHASELDSVLLNFLTNSIKSMRRARTENRRVRMDGRRDGKYVVVGFEDNGEGVAMENRDRVFDAFFTTTLTADDDGVAGPGTGLGLKIVSDVARSYGGYASISEPSEGYTCRFEFRVLAADATGSKV
jgi:signal transduction histidine kinase